MGFLPQTLTGCSFAALFAARVPSIAFKSPTYGPFAKCLSKSAAALQRFAISMVKLPILYLIQLETNVRIRP